MQIATIGVDTGKSSFPAKQPVGRDQGIDADASDRRWCPLAVRPIS
jgi:hypothetical protein